MTDDDIEIHPKAWGEEHWIVNKEYCGKKLVLKAGHRCSVHYHKIKDEVFYVTSGLVLMEVGDCVRVLGPEFARSSQSPRQFPGKLLPANGNGAHSRNGRRAHASESRRA